MPLFSFLHRHAAAAPAPAAVVPAGIPVGTTPPAQAGKNAVVKMKTVKKKKEDGSGLSSFLSSLNHIGLGKECVHFIQNIAILLDAGLNLTEALATVELETRSKAMKKIIAGVREDVANGSAFWRAMEKQHLFSPYTLAMIRIGEEAGALAKNMEYLAVQQEKDRSLRQKVKMAMIYPSIVLTLTFIITLGLAWFVLPKLVTVLLSLDAELPLVTKIIIAIANFFSAHGTVAVPLFLVLTLFVVLICKFTALRGPTQQLIFRIPGIGSLAKHATVARFGVILGSLLHAGVPLIEALRSLADVTTIVSYQKFYYRLAKEVEIGQSFEKSFHSIKSANRLLPISVQQLVVTGEKSGSLADMLMKIAEIYEKKAEETAHKLPVILEPMLLFFIGGIVGTVAFAIIVPIYSIVGSIGR